MLNEKSLYKEICTFVIQIKYSLVKDGNDFYKLMHKSENLHNSAVLESYVI